MNIKNKFIKILFTILILSILFVMPTFAEDKEEVPPNIDIYESYEGWYKNFIVECGACRITLRNYDGSIINDFYVLPKQFENNTELQRIMNVKGVDNQKDSKGRTILFMQENEGKLDLKDYNYNGLEIKYSDNIPQLAKRLDENDNELPFVYFEPFNKDFKTVESWKEYNNGENVNKLAVDLGIDISNLCKDPKDNRELSFYEWVTTTNNTGVSPSLELQPLTLYPETTEQIYCNDFYTAQDNCLQWNSDMGKYCMTLYKEGSDFLSIIGNMIDGALMALFGGTKIGLGDLITFYNGRIVYYDVGVMVTDIVTDVVETGNGKTYNNGSYSWADIDMGKFEDMFPDATERWNIKIEDLSEEQLNAILKTGAQKVDDLRAPSEISRVITKEILAPKYVVLTYTETTKYSHPWETKGFWANYKRVDVSDAYSTLEEMLEHYFVYNTAEEINAGSYMSAEESRQMRLPFYNLEKKTEQTTTALLKSMNKYHISFEDYYLGNGYERDGDSFHLPVYKGIGDDTKIKTDHNKYVTIINNIESMQNTLNIVINQASFNCSSLPKYGAGIICASSNIPYKQILFKFHSNLEQIGGTGEMDDQYNIFGNIDANTRQIGQQLLKTSLILCIFSSF